MTGLQLHHVQLARVAREAFEVGDTRMYRRAVGALERCACDGSVGDDAEPVNTATLPQLLFALDMEASGFTWSPTVVEWADETGHGNRAMLTHAREAAQSNVRQLVRAAQAALRANNSVSASVLYTRALRRWARFEEQARGFAARAANANRSAADRYDDWSRDLERRGRDAITPDSPLTLPLVIAGLLALLYLR